MARRARGTGSVRRRKDGRGWEGRYTAGRTPDGRQIQRSVYAPTERECIAKLDEANRRVNAGLLEVGPRVTLAEYLRDWVEGRRRRVRPNTWLRYRGLIEQQVIPHLGTVPVVRLTRGRVERWLDDLVEGGLSPRTAHHARAVLRAALERACRDGQLVRNVAADAEPPSVPDEERQVFTPEEVQRFIAAARGDRYEAVYLVALATGLRQGEVLGLRWQDIDLAGGSLSVVHELDARTHTLQPPKTPKSRATVPLPAVAAAALRAHRVRQESLRRFLVREQWGNAHDLVFTTQLGKPVHGPHVTRQFQALCRRAGIRVLTFHSLRHATGTLMHALGVDVKVVQRVLRHTSVRTTADTYTHVLPQVLIDAAERLDALLAPMVEAGR